MSAGGRLPVARIVAALTYLGTIAGPRR